MANNSIFLSVILLFTMTSFGMVQGQGSVDFSKQQSEAIERYRQEAIAARNQWVRDDTSYRQSILTEKVSSKQLSTPDGSANTPILVFVSSSLPRSSLIALMQDAQQIHATVIIRGLINNSFKDTITYVTSIVKDAPGSSFQINPPIFTQYQITQVPSVVVLSQDENHFDKLSGNLPLLASLREIRNRGEVKPPQLTDAISRLEKIHV